ncbi:hypothetical protein EJ07DRAFT_186505 [Lizonia empirigonia]|nr:hypothetical protein EJ07DRAFT_186505 [Lizonia empirigonia]
MAITEQEAHIEELKKAEMRELPAANKLYSEKIAEEKRVAAARAKEDRDRAKADERAAIDARKEQRRQDKEARDSDCSTFKKQWRLVNSRVEPVVIEPIVIGLSAQSSEAARFLKNTPSPKDWYQRQLEVVFTPQKYQSALSSLFTRDHATETTHRTQYPNSRIDIGKRFATLTNSSLQNSKLQKSFLTSKRLFC